MTYYDREDCILPFQIPLSDIQSQIFPDSFIFELNQLCGQPQMEDRDDLTE